MAITRRHLDVPPTAVFAVFEDGRRYAEWVVGAQEVRAVDEADPLLLNFLELLIENHRMPVIFRTRRAYDDLWQERNRLLPVSVTSAVELPEETVRAIGDRIAEQTGRRVDLSSHVDADILGGIVVRVGNQILDASIRNRLDQLRKQVARA